MKKLIYLLIIMSLTLVGCSNNKPQKSNLSYGMIKSKVRKGRTSQSDLLRIFGAPNLVTKNGNNNEVWSYNKMSVDKKSQGDKTWKLFVQEYGSTSSTTTSSFDFIVVFDDFDIVKDYSVITSNY
ncbi:MAG: hypothetical protein Q7K48_00090 [Fusobacterium sp. JB021]|nr:hypothetical protein [Fusobacterium sp. JB020]MDP0492705.1 hypothetical protein [Fusobacterium sp. JB021]